MLRIHIVRMTTRSFFFKGQSVRDSTENFQENKGHSKVLSTGLGKIRDSLCYVI